MSYSLGIIIPDYKSPFLEEVIQNSLLLSPEKIVVSNFKTSETVLLQNKYSHIKNIQFLNFEERMNPGDYRNEGVLKCFHWFIPNCFLCVCVFFVSVLLIRIQNKVICYIIFLNMEFILYCHRRLFYLDNLRQYFMG